MGSVSTNDVLRLRIYLLGQFRMEYDGHRRGCVRSRCEVLLAYLLLHPCTSHSRHYLAFLLWPDSTERQALTNLRHILHDLRAALPEPDRYLIVTHQTIEWRDDRAYLDVADFRHHSRPDADEIDLETALELYRNDLLPAWYDEWIEAERRLLRHQYCSVIERLVNARRRAGDWHRAIDLAERLVAVDPLSEASYRLLIRLHLANADRGAALQVYRTCIATLRQELEAQPSPATEALYRESINSNMEAR